MGLVRANVKIRFVYFKIFTIGQYHVENNKTLVPLSI